VPFRLAAVPLPLSPREAAAAKAAKASPGARNGQIAFAVPPFGGKTAELEVGLSRQEAKGWGPVRWRTVEIDDGKSATLEEVPPGTYRVRLNLRPWDAHGAAGNPVGLKPSAEAPVRVEAGKAARVSAVRR
jgi:hypothetical protein